MEINRKGCLRFGILATLVLITGLVVLSRGGAGMPQPARDLDTSRHSAVAIFGATGTVGDGLLKAAMEDDGVKKIQIVTRRSTPRIEEGVSSGRVTVTTHMDYLDYSALQEILAEVDTVFWAVGTSTTNVSKDEYGVIHVDFPVAFIHQWLAANPEGELSFHYVSGSGAAKDSSWHWAREKARAEQVLFDLADGTHLRVVSYRPGAVIHTQERANFGDTLKQLLLGPFELAANAPVIGQAMLEATARGDELGNGAILENRDILMYANGYTSRTSTPQQGEVGK